MMRLLWKEWRERLGWGLAWTAAVLGVSLFAHGQAFCGDRVAWVTAWPVLPLLLALLAGAGGYASETKAGRAEFLFSRPVSGGRVLLGKLLYGAMIAFGAPLLAAVIFYGIADPAYHAQMTFPHLLLGVWDLGWKMGALYLLGLACAPVVPGLFGGIMTFAVLVVLVFAAILVSMNGIYEARSHFDLTRWYDGAWWDMREYAVPACIVLGAVLAAWAGGYALTRFGHTLTPTQRIARYTRVVLPVVLLFWLAGFLLPTPWLAACLTRQKTISTNISPSGRYAYVLTRTWATPLGMFELGDAPGSEEFGNVIDFGTGQPRQVQLTEVRNGQFRHFTNPDVSNFSWQWTPEDIGYYVDGAHALMLVNPERRQVRQVVFHIGAIQNTNLSPDGHHLLVQLSTKDQAPNNSRPPNTVASLCVVNLRTGQKSRHIVFPPNETPGSFWQSPDTIEYNTTIGKTWQHHTARLSDFYK